MAAKKPKEHRIVKRSVNYSEKRKDVAFILSLFLGILGIDRFYLGYIGAGLLKLVLTLSAFYFEMYGFYFLLLAIFLWVFDIVIIWVGAMEDYEGRLLKRGVMEWWIIIFAIIGLIVFVILIIFFSGGFDLAFRKISGLFEGVGNTTEIVKTTI